MRPAEHGQDAAFTQRDRRFETIAYLPRYWNFESIPLQRRVIRTWITPTISKPHYPVAQSPARFCAPLRFRFDDEDLGSRLARRTRNWIADVRYLDAAFGRAQ